MEPTGTNGRTRHTFQPFPCLVGWVSSCGGFSRWMAGNAVSCGHNDDVGKAFCFASVVRFPDRHDRNRGWFRCRPPVSRLAVCIGFAVVMAQVRRPVPFRTRKLRPGRGDGTALERVWESSTPPHSTLEDPPVEPHGGIPGGSSSCFRGFPSGVTLREPLFVVLPACRPCPSWGSRKGLFSYSRGVPSSTHWSFLDAEMPVSGRIAPPTGCFVPLRGPWAGGLFQ